MFDLKELTITILSAARESARRKALEALGMPVLVCDMCKDECFERCQHDDNQWLCIQCVEGLRIDAARDGAGILKRFKERIESAKDHDRAKSEWVTERAALMRQRDEAQRERLSEVAKVQEIAIGRREELKSVMRRVEDLKGDLVAANARADKAERQLEILDGVSARMMDLFKDHVRAASEWITERNVLMRQRDEARGSLVELQEQAGGAALSDLTRIHDEALAALSVAIQRAETAEVEVDRTANAPDDVDVMK